MTCDSELLFYDGDLRATIEAHFQKVNEKVAAIPEPQFLATEDDLIVEHVVADFQVNPLELDEDAAQMEQEETRVDVTHMARHDPFDDGGPIMMPGQRVTVSIPFSGDRGLWKLRPSSWHTSFPHGIIRSSGDELGGFLEIVVELPSDCAPEQFKQRLDYELRDVRFYLEKQKPDIEQLNNALPNKVRHVVQARRARLERHGKVRDLLTDPLRSLPVMLLTQPDRKRLRVPMSDYVLDPAYVARRTQGVAHIVLMPWELGFKWTELVGKPWSAFLGAARTYYPGLDFDEQLPSSHPRTMAEDILFWRYTGLEGEVAFAEFLIHQAMRHAAGKRINWDDLVFLNDARTKRAELARQQTTEERDWRALYDEEIAALNKKSAELHEENEALSDDAIAATKAKGRTDDENNRLRAQLDALRAALSQKTGQDPDESIPIPQSYENFSDWVEQHLTGRLLLHPRALRGLKEACYENVTLVYQAMLLLGKEYRDMKLGTPTARHCLTRNARRWSYDSISPSLPAGQANRVTNTSCDSRRILPESSFWNSTCAKAAPKTRGTVWRSTFFGTTKHGRSLSAGCRAIWTFE